MMNNQDNNPILRSDTASLEFRIWFRDEFNIDYLDAIESLRNNKKESDRKWHQVLVKHNLI